MSDTNTAISSTNTSVSGTDSGGGDTSSTAVLDPQTNPSAGAEASEGGSALDAPLPESGEQQDGTTEQAPAQANDSAPDLSALYTLLMGDVQDAPEQTAEPKAEAKVEQPQTQPAPVQAPVEDFKALDESFASAFGNDPESMKYHTTVKGVFAQQAQALKAAQSELAQFRAMVQPFIQYTASQAQQQFAKDIGEHFASDAEFYGPAEKQGEKEFADRRGKVADAAVKLLQRSQQIGKPITVNQAFSYARMLVGGEGKTNQAQSRTTNRRVSSSASGSATSPARDGDRFARADKDIEATLARIRGM